MVGKEEREEREKKERDQVRKGRKSVKTRSPLSLKSLHDRGARLSGTKIAFGIFVRNGSWFSEYKDNPVAFLATVFNRF